MKEGKSINELASELTKIRESSKDLIVPVNMMHSVQTNNDVGIEISEETYMPSNWAHSQISTYTDIPKEYYDRIKKENSNLFCSSINHGFQMAAQKALLKKSSESRMVRITDNKIRGFLSSRYRRLDSYDLLETVLPILIDNTFEIKSCEITEKKMYLKAITPMIERDIKPGFPVRYGLTISSSDVGCGSLQVSPFLMELVCQNGMTMDHSIRKFHIGENQTTDSITELLTDATKTEMDKAFWMQVRDIVIGTMKMDVFEKQLDKLRDASTQMITNYNFEKVVELTMKEVGIKGGNIKDSIVAQLATGSQGRGLNKWGLANAFTWAAQNAIDVDYDEASDLESAGGKIIELSKDRFNLIAT